MAESTVGVTYLKLPKSAELPAGGIAFKRGSTIRIVTCLGKDADATTWKIISVSAGGAASKFKPYRLNLATAGHYTALLYAKWQPKSRLRMTPKNVMAVAYYLDIVGRR